MMKKRILTLLLALTMLSALFVSCKKEKEPDGLKLTDENGAIYTIVRPSKMANFGKEAVTELKEGLKELTDCDFTVTDDMKSSEPGEYEILVGKTNREESVDIKDGYRIYVSGTKIVILGSSDLAIYRAVLTLLYDVLHLDGEGQPEKDKVSVAKDLDISGTVTESTIDDAGLAALRAETDKRIDEILTTENIDVSGAKKVRYVSNNGNDDNNGLTPETAWATLDKVNTSVYSGEAVLFERGGTWRGQIVAVKGVTYSAYGEGEKPNIYGSLKNYADPSLWVTTTATDVYKLKDYISTSDDVGLMVFNNGEKHGIKVLKDTEKDLDVTTNLDFSSYHDLNSNENIDLRFYHDGSGYVYLYCKEGNPGTVFEDIELGRKSYIIEINEGKDNVTINNLCIKYGGGHGVGSNTVKNLKVTDCEFGWIGGSIQGYGLYGRSYGTRFGNAVQIWGGCDGYTVSNNYIYQIYDAGITQQYNTSGTKLYNMKNILYSNNVVEYCNYSIEYFLGTEYGENKSTMSNFVIRDNLMWYAGYGLCEQRPDGGQAAHIKSWVGEDGNTATDFVVENNLFALTKESLFQISWGIEPGAPTMNNNTYIATEGCKVCQFGKSGKTGIWMNNATEIRLLQATGERTAKAIIKK